MDPAGVSSIPPRQSQSSGRYIRNLRWYICGLLFFATTINYIDRQVLGILKPVLDNQLHINQAEYGWIIFGFQLSYAVVMPFAGRLIDWLGTRTGYLLAVIVWSAAAMAHAAARTAVQFALARFFLGAGESSNFPAAFRTVADWFPRRERALAGGIFNSGSNIGALVAPLVVPYLATHYGWHSAFLFTGSLGLVWIAFWLLLYHQPRQHPRLSPRELDLIESDSDPEPTASIPWLKLLTNRASLAFIAGKFLTDPVWWFYLYWTPDFLHRKYGLNITELGLPLVVIYLTADVGSVGGGWLSSFLLNRGWPVGRARKAAMLVCALCVTAVIFVPYTGGRLWLTVILIAIAASAHQGWSANLFTMTSDTFPRKAVASVVGIGGFWGAISGMIAAPIIGAWLQFSHDTYAPLFIGAGCAYLIALLIIHVLLPRFNQVQL
ncbi:MAG TPA: MFS transporter [Bryobacteraceae bacterium]|nr:MFS transporter [Bryobacteraceae bacterium]